MKIAIHCMTQNEILCLYYNRRKSACGGKCMQNEYRRFLKNQVGKKNYASFVRSVNSGSASVGVVQKEVYLELYQILQSLQQKTLVGKYRQLEHVIRSVTLIGKTYYLAVGMYCAAVLLLLVCGTVPILTYAGIGLLSAAFAWKTYEYIGNRFCYTDVRLILIYKMVLECLILETNQKEQKEL